MYRKDFIKGLLVAGVAATALALGAGSASAQTKWNLPAAYPNDNPHTENLVLFAKDVEAATAGLRDRGRPRDVAVADAMDAATPLFPTP